MCGVTGSEVAEALFLEHKENTRTWAIIHYLLFSITLPIGVYIYFRDIYNLTGVVAILTLLVFSREIQLSFLKEDPKTYFKAAIFPLVNNWKPDILHKQSSNVGEKIIIAFMFFLFAGVPLILIGWKAGNIVLDYIDKMDSAICNIFIAMILPNKSYFLDWLGIILLIGLILYNRYYKNKEPLPLIPPEDKEKIDSAFDHYIRTTIIKDPDELC